jgi:aminopeptidase N
MTGNMRLSLSCLFLFLAASCCLSQSYTRQDTLRGTITPERAWWDLVYYHLDITVDPDARTVEGTNTIRYRVLRGSQTMQIDLQPPMEIKRIVQDGDMLDYRRDGNVYYVQLASEQKPGTTDELVVHYGGTPRVAPNPPWNSGMVWSSDSSGKPFAASVSWGAGSSQWWPCKDHMYDEVDSMLFSITVREDLVAVGNGKFVGKENHRTGLATYHWRVANPINNYGVNFNIADYGHFSDTLKGEKGTLPCDYYVLRENLDKAKTHFGQVPGILEALEYWHGPYPFYEDGYKLVEVPYSGMEHQSATAYGNDYLNGYKGEDRSNSGWGAKLDFIIVHETGHEWYANNITFRDIADIWVHEGFTTYSDGLVIEYHFGKEAGSAYIRGLRKSIQHDRPMIGNYGIHDTDYSRDNYSKGAAIIHTLRQVVNDDEKWRALLRRMNRVFFHQTVTTGQIEDFIADETGLQLDKFWDQYLRTTKIPTLEYYFAQGILSYRWINAIDGFQMPVWVSINGVEQWLYPQTAWRNMELGGDRVRLSVDPDFYVSVLYSNAR